MPLQLIKETKASYNVIGEGTTQVLVEGDLIVPDIKPDISSVLRVNANPVIFEEKAAEDRVGFKGLLNVNVIYMAKKAEKPVHSMNDVMNFEDFITIEGTTRASDIETMCELTHLEYKLINDRKIGIKAIVTVKACVTERIEEEYLKDVQGDSLQVKNCEVTMPRLAESKKDKFVLKETFSIDSNKPEVGDVVDCQVGVNKKETKAVRGGVNVKGDMEVNLLYAGMNEDSNIELAEFIVPFNGMVEADNINEDMDPNVRLVVEKIDHYISSNHDGEDRVLELEVTVGVVANATEKEKMQMVEDVYSMDKELEIERKNIEFMVPTGKTEARVSIKEEETLDNSYPDIMQVVKAWGTCYMDNIVPEENAIVVEGAVAVQLMYIAEDDDTPVQVVDFMVPFEQRVELKGANDESKIEAKCGIERISINMMTGREIEVNIILVIEAQAFEKKSVQVVHDVKETTSQKNPSASVVIYVVQKGDTLWCIAKKFNTTVDNILLINDIENPDLIYPGQKVLILRTCK